MFICVWHTNKAVLARCQPAFKTTEGWIEFYNFWFSILNSAVEKTYKERLTEFEKKYASTNLEQVGYIKETWLLPYKEKFVITWVDQQAHFGNTITSRVEGIHTLLKSYLRRLRAYSERISQLAISHYFRDWDPCHLLCFSPKWISISPWHSTPANNAKSTAGSFGQTYYFKRMISWHC